MIPTVTGKYFKLKFLFFRKKRNQFSKPLYDNPLVYKNKKMAKEMYYRAIEKNRSLQQLGHKKFVFEIQPILRILNSLKQQKFKSNNLNQNNDNLLHEIKDQTFADESEIVLNMVNSNELVDEPEQIVKETEIKLVKKYERFFDIEDLHDNLDDFLNNLDYENDQSENLSEEVEFLN